MSEARRRGRDARVEVQVVPASERYFGSLGTAPEPGSGSDPDDDGRGFFSAGWGNGHEGAGIEILDVAFVKVSHANFLLFSLRVMSGVDTFLVVCAGRHGSSGAWTWTTESQAAPWRVCC